MSKLKIKIDRFGTSVVMCVLDQCDSIRCKPEGEILRYKAKNGIEITSILNPELQDDKILLRGEARHSDNNIAYCQFDTEEEAEEALKKYIEALKEWADNGYFNGSKDDTASEDNVYEF